MQALIHQQFCMQCFAGLAASVIHPAPLLVALFCHNILAHTQTVASEHYRQLSKRVFR